MLYLSFNICLYDKNHIKLLLDVIKNHHINKPVFIVQHENNFQISFESDYEQYELQNEFANNFQNYEYTQDISSGREEILLSINRLQSPSSSDNWGRTWNSDPLEKTIYLVKVRERTPLKSPSTKFWVLFDTELKEYKVNIVPGIIPDTGEEGFLVTDGEGEESKIISELLPDKTQAFWEGYGLAVSQIETAYEIYKNENKKKRKSRKAKQ